MNVDTIRVEKREDKSRVVYISYKTGFAGWTKNEMFRIVPSYTKKGVKHVISHAECVDGYSVIGKTICNVRASYKEIIENIGNLVY